MKFITLTSADPSGMLFDVNPDNIVKMYAHPSTPTTTTIDMVSGVSLEVKEARGVIAMMVNQAQYSRGPV